MNIFTTKQEKTVQEEIQATESAMLRSTEEQVEGQKSALQMFEAAQTQAQLEAISIQDEVKEIEAHRANVDSYLISSRSRAKKLGNFARNISRLWEEEEHKPKSVKKPEPRK
jgi:hypothetical protein|tara:strand:+ start:1093 stop:1428 length:336 start_codon:yes stop_codon:yes gene_type:complete